MRGLGFLLEKPWLPQSDGGPSGSDSGPRMPASKVSLIFLLAVISSLFILFFVTFISRSQFEDFRALAGEPWQPFTDSLRLWINSGVLLIASLGMHFAVRSVKARHPGGLLLSLCVGAIGALLFIALQVSVWQYLLRLGYGVSGNPANSYFFILTGLHVVHLAGGLAALARVFWRLYRHRSPDNVQTAIEGCALYWHYLFVLWLVLFFMLTRTPEAYATIAALCGLG